MVIFKYPLIIGHSTIEMPKDAKPLFIALQNDEPMLWAAVDPQRGAHKFEVLCLGTGWDFEPYGAKIENYVGTIAQEKFVWHYFIEPYPDER